MLLFVVCFQWYYEVLYFDCFVVQGLYGSGEGWYDFFFFCFGSDLGEQFLGYDVGVFFQWFEWVVWVVIVWVLVDGWGDLGQCGCGGQVEGEQGFEFYDGGIVEFQCGVCSKVVIFM